MEPQPHVSGSNDAVENKAYMALGQQGHLRVVVAPGFGESMLLGVWWISAPVKGAEHAL